MGLIIYNYTTKQGFLVPELYIRINCIRMLKTTGGSDYGMVYNSLAYKSFSDFEAGTSPLTIPNHFANVEDYLTSADFYKQTIFGFAYDAIKRTWENNGYTVTKNSSHSITSKTYTYDCFGYNVEGFNVDGYNRQGYDHEGYNKEGYNIMGLGRNGDPCAAPPQPSMLAPSS